MCLEPLCQTSLAPTRLMKTILVKDWPQITGDLAVHLTGLRLGEQYQANILPDEVIQISNAGPMYHDSHYGIRRERQCIHSV